MAALLVGPMLRYVDRSSALVWVETDRPCRVSVLGETVSTFTVHGHHYGLVEIDGLDAGSTTEYAVALDGEVVWPEAGERWPAPRIRTLGDGPVRLVFGSCRMSVPHDAEHTRVFGADALRAYAHRLATADEAPWPDALLLMGDQVYADETSEAMQAFIASRRDTSVAPGTEIADFEEYAHLYRLAWSDPAVRWLLSTVPSAMIFDDHDVRDDWNTSLAWREKVSAAPWWRDRITGGIGAYWLYQHVGNLSPQERRDDPLLTALRSADGDAGGIVDDVAWTADQDPSTVRWSYARDFGTVRLLMLDTRCGRVLEPGRRSMLNPEDKTWLDDQLSSTHGADHVLIGTSLPYLLPRGLHDLEAWNEAVADGAWGGRAARAAESMRQGIDLEHWAAFGDSFRAMATAITDTATRAGRAPATITFLSGDVHYSYAARADYSGQGRDTSRIYQLVCSPIRNPLGRGLRYLNGFAAFGVARAASSALVRGVRLPPSGLDWAIEAGPRFANALATVELDGRRAQVRWEAATVDDGVVTMTPMLEADL